MTLMVSHAARKGTPTVYCDWYRRQATVVNGKCALCGARLHRPWTGPK